MANNILIVNTIKHLRLKQIYYQLYYRLFSHKLMEYNVPRQSSLRMVSVIAKWYCYNVPKTFTFLNLIGDFKSWNDVSHGMLWAYNLNYMDWLLQPDMTFEQGSEWVERFITDLPTNRIGLDPYPIALRSINWIKFIGRHHKIFPIKKCMTRHPVCCIKSLMNRFCLMAHITSNHRCITAFCSIGYWIAIMPRLIEVMRKCVSF